MFRALNLAPSIFLLCVCTILVSPSPAHADTLNSVESQGALRCGVTDTGPGLSTTDRTGRVVGFYPDLCRAIAAAVLGNSEAVEFVRVDLGSRFTALNERAIDVLMGQNTWTLMRDVDLDLTLAATAFFDGQGFLALRDVGVQNLSDLDHASICVHEDTTAIQVLRDLVRTTHPNLELRTFRSESRAFVSFFSRGCDLMAQDITVLIAQRLALSPNPDDYVLLEEVLSHEPIGPVVREDDESWAEIVRWVIYALIIAEEHGVDQANVDNLPDSAPLMVRRMLGYEDESVDVLGLDRDWAQRVIAQVGNYGEIYNRNLGPGTAVDLPRGINALWRDGGLIYAPLFR